MKTRLMPVVALALLACTSQVVPAQNAPQPQPLPAVRASTLLFVLFFWGGNYADTADPIDINAFNIDFGDDLNGNPSGSPSGKSDSTTNAVDVLLHGN
jgi:hypothetical protein